MAVNTVGAVCFGVMIGWVTYRTLRRTGETVAVSNIASVVGAVGGAAVTGMFKGNLFGWYCIGLAARHGGAGRGSRTARSAGHSRTTRCAATRRRHAGARHAALGWPRAASAQLG